MAAHSRMDLEKGADMTEQANLKKDKKESSDSLIKIAAGCAIVLIFIGMANLGTGLGPVIVMIVLMLLAKIPAQIAEGKGYSYWAFYIFGLFFFLPALVVILLMGDKAAEKNTPSYSEADEIAKYKKLLDDGALTKDEFETKKGQLLGLSQPDRKEAISVVVERYEDDEDGEWHECFTCPECSDCWQIEDGAKEAVCGNDDCGCLVNLKRQG